jgi:hypothetical protein
MIIFLSIIFQEHMLSVIFWNLKNLGYDKTYKFLLNITYILK